MSSVNLNTIEAMVREVLKELIQEAHVPTKVGMPSPQLPPKRSKTKTKVGMPAPQLPPKRPKTKTKVGMPAPQLPPEVKPEPKKRKKPLSRSDRKARDVDQAGKEPPEVEEVPKEPELGGYKKASGGKFFEGNEDEER